MAELNNKYNSEANFNNINPQNNNIQSSSIMERFKKMMDKKKEDDNKRQDIISKQKEQELKIIKNNSVLDKNIIDKFNNNSKSNINIKNTNLNKIVDNNVLISETDLDIKDNNRKSALGDTNKRKKMLNELNSEDNVKSTYKKLQDTKIENDGVIVNENKNDLFENNNLNNDVETIINLDSNNNTNIIDHKYNIKKSKKPDPKPKPNSKYSNYNSYNSVHNIKNNLDINKNEYSSISNISTKIKNMVNVHEKMIIDNNFNIDILENHYSILNKFYNNNELSEEQEQQKDKIFDMYQLDIDTKPNNFKLEELIEHYKELLLKAYSKKSIENNKRESIALSIIKSNRKISKTDMIINDSNINSNVVEEINNKYNINNKDVNSDMSKQNEELINSNDENSKDKELKYNINSLRVDNVAINFDIKTCENKNINYNLAYCINNIIIYDSKKLIEQQQLNCNINYLKTNKNNNNNNNNNNRNLKNSNLNICKLSFSGISNNYTNNKFVSNRETEVSYFNNTAANKIKDLNNNIYNNKKCEKANGESIVILPVESKKDIKINYNKNYNASNKDSTKITYSDIEVQSKTSTFNLKNLRKSSKKVSIVVSNNKNHIEYDNFKMNNNNNNNNSCKNEVYLNNNKFKSNILASKTINPIIINNYINPFLLDILCINCYNFIKIEDIDKHSETCLIKEFDIDSKDDKNDTEDDYNAILYKLYEVIVSKFNNIQNKNNDTNINDNYNKLKSITYDAFMNNYSLKKLVSNKAQLLLLIDNIEADINSNVNKESIYNLYYLCKRVFNIVVIKESQMKNVLNEIIKKSKVNDKNNNCSVLYSSNNEEYIGDQENLSDDLKDEDLKSIEGNDYNDTKELKDIRNELYNLDIETLKNKEVSKNIKQIIVIILFIKLNEGNRSLEKRSKSFGKCYEI